MIDFDSMLKLINENEVFTIFGHAMPDGDCYGSQVALKELIQNNCSGKKVYILGSGLPRFFGILSPTDQADDETVASSVAVLVDVSCVRRAEDPRAATAKAFGKFDHHRPNPEREVFEGVAIVDWNRISNCELIAEFALAMGWTISRKAAEALYLGISTDSGHFRYHGVTERTRYLVRELKRCGARFRLIDRVAFREPIKIVRFKRYMRFHAKRYRSVCYLVLTEQEYVSRGISLQKVIHLVNVLSGVHRSCHTYALFVYENEEKIRVELRSNKGYPVHDVAKAFRGGGHAYASGCDIDLAQGEKVEDVLEAMDKIGRNENAGV